MPLPSVLFLLFFLSFTLFLSLRLSLSLKSQLLLLSAPSIPGACALIGIRRRFPIPLLPVDFFYCVVSLFHRVISSISGYVLLGNSFSRSRSFSGVDFVTNFPLWVSCNLGQPTPFFKLAAY